MKLYASISWLLVVLSTNALCTYALYDQCTCEVRSTALLKVFPDETSIGSHQFDCTAGPGETKFTRIDMDIDTEGFFFMENENRYREGKWFIQFPCDWIVNNALPAEKNYQVSSLTLEEIKTLYIAPSTRYLRGMQENIYENRLSRRRLSNVGKQECGIVIVHAADAVNPLTTAEAESMLYNKASGQFRDCSNRAMELVKKDETVTITLPKKISEYTSNNVDEDLFKMICEYYGYGSACEIANERGLDHILFSLPFGLSDDNPGTFWAKGSAGDSRRFSVYCGGASIVDGQYYEGGFFFPSTIMHELGHNYRLGHALDPRENGDSAYGDKTTHMGGGRETKKCFNGYNYYVLGWHDKQTNEVPLVSGTAYKYNVKGISDVSTGGIVNIKAGNYFITFNLKKGINSGIDDKGYDEDYTDEVIIHEGKDIQFGQTVLASYFSTSLVGDLKEEGDQFEVAVANGNLRIQLCSIDTDGSDGAMLSIGLDAVNCDGVGPINHPQGMRSLVDGVPATNLSGSKDDILEFIMEVPYQPDSVTCATSGGRGDVDLIMNFLSSPQILYSGGGNACYSRGLTTEQSCTSMEPSGRYLYVVVEGDEAFSGVTIECKVQGGITHPPTPAPTQPVTTIPSSVLQSGVPKTNINIAIGQPAYYTMPMPDNAVSVACAISGGTGDADLFTRWDKEVDLSTPDVNDCAPLLLGNEEFCDASRIGSIGSILHVTVDAYRQVSDLTLLCTVETFESPVTTEATTSSATTGITTTFAPPTTTTTTTTTTASTLPICPDTSSLTVKFHRTQTTINTRRCAYFDRKVIYLKLCKKNLVNSNLKVRDVCVQECSSKTNVCVRA